MATNYKFGGNVLNYANGSGSDLASGNIVSTGGLVGVALVDIANGESGSVAITGVFEVANGDSTAIPQGAELFYDSATGKVDGTNTSNKFAGYAWEAAAAGSATVLLRLKG